MVGYRRKLFSSLQVSKNKFDGYSYQKAYLTVPSKYVDKLDFKKGDKFKITRRGKRLSFTKI